MFKESALSSTLVVEDLARELETRRFMCTRDDRATLVAAGWE